MQKLRACINICEDSQIINSNLACFTREFILKSFEPTLEKLCFRHYMHNGMGDITNNCFTEGENGALARDSSGPKSNFSLCISCDAINGHLLRRYSLVKLY